MRLCFGEMGEVSHIEQSRLFPSEYDRRINIHRTAYWLPGCDDADGSNRQQSANEGQRIERPDAVEGRRDNASQGQASQ